MARNSNQGVRHGNFVQCYSADFCIVLSDLQ